MVQRLQSTMDSHFGVLQHLSQQTADAANQMQTAIKDLQQKLNAQNDAVNGKLDTASGQMQSLNDSVDELKARIAKLDRRCRICRRNFRRCRLRRRRRSRARSRGNQDSRAATMRSQVRSGHGPGQQPGMAANASSAQAPPLQETFQAGVRDLQRREVRAWRRRSFRT